MVHIVGQTGQMANQLFRFAHHLANAIEYNLQLTHYSFDFPDLFPHIVESRHVTLRQLPKPINQTFARIAGFVENNKITNAVGYRIIASPYDFNDENKEILKAALHQNLIFTDWLFRDYQSLQKHFALIKKLFLPQDNIVGKTSQQATDLRSGADKLIGLHVRRGDYADWNGGRFFYNDDQYANFMRQLSEIYSGEKLRFIVCTNGKIATDRFDGFDFVISQNTGVEDLHLLGECDLILGPPSSFSAWASLMGQKPLFHVNDPNEPLAVAHFAVCEG